MGCRGKEGVVLQVLYQRGLSTGDFRGALPVLLGEGAASGLSPTTITRLTTAWEAEYRSFCATSLAERDYQVIISVDPSSERAFRGSAPVAKEVADRVARLAVKLQVPAPQSMPIQRPPGAQ